MFNIPTRLITAEPHNHRRYYPRVKRNKTEKKFTPCCYCYVGIAPHDPHKKELPNGDVCHDYCKVEFERKSKPN